MRYGNVNSVQNAYLQGPYSAGNTPRPFHLASMSPYPPPDHGVQTPPPGFSVADWSSAPGMAPYLQQWQPMYPQQQLFPGATYMQQQPHSARTPRPEEEYGRKTNFGVVPSQADMLVGAPAQSGQWTAGNAPALINESMDDDDAPLPFPPSHLIAEYPFDFQQKLIVYYRLLRRHYPELYEQYCHFYITYYEPLYYPEKAAEEERREQERVMAKKQLEREERRRREPERRVAREDAEKGRRENDTQTRRQAEAGAYQQRQLEGQLQMLQQAKAAGAASQVAAASPLGNGDGITRTSSILSRQSSIRRQNSLRRSDANQQKNEVSFNLFPSVHQP